MSSLFPNGNTSCTKDTNTCGTCVYWSGRRNVLGELVEYDVYESARCNNVQSPAYQHEVSASHCCSMKESF